MDIENFKSIMENILSKRIPNESLQYVYGEENPDLLKRFLIERQLLNVGSADDPDVWDKIARVKAEQRNQSAQAYRKGDSNPNGPIAEGGSSNVEKKIPVEPKEDASSTDAAGKKKNKFVPLFSEAGEKRMTVILPGRHECQCLATRHKLIGNCLNCGRVVCEQERSGPCFFCDNLVCTKEEREVLARNSKQSEKLRRKLMSGKLLKQCDDGYSGEDGSESVPSRDDAGLLSAIQQKNRLLEFDRTSAKRTRVIDDEMDYFATDGNAGQWLTAAQRTQLEQARQALQTQRHASKAYQPITVTLDFAGRRVIEENHSEAAARALYAPENDPMEELLQQFKASEIKQQEQRVPSDLVADIPERAYRDDGRGIVNPYVSNPPKFIADETKVVKHAPVATTGNVRKADLRMQDQQLKELRDDGYCLCVHQPWASLLVCGVKKHEGRSWYSTHRGRLWIASAAQAPDLAEVKSVEQTYIALGVSSRDLPGEYPVGCLLGCVNMDDCLPQEEYKNQFPNGDCDAPYVFICTHPQELRVKFPLQRKNKIYKLDPHFHAAALRGLR